MIATRWDTADDVTPEELEEYKAAATSTEDQALFDSWTAGLPQDAMYGLGAHDLPILRRVLDLAEPDHILEIGFGAGASSTMFLHLSRAWVTSVDWTEDWRVLVAAMNMAQRFSPRFRFVHGDSRRVYDHLWHLQQVTPWQLAFVDGGHDYETVAADLSTVSRLRVPWILVDDWWPLLGPGVRKAVEEREDLELFLQFGNLVLLKARAAAGAGSGAAAPR